MLFTSGRDKPGYMKRLKALWDEIRPEYSHLSDKNCDRVDRIIKKNLLADYITLYYKKTCKFRQRE